MTVRQGQVVTELAVLLLAHYQLLEAAQLLCRYGVSTGQGPRLARLAEQIMDQYDWHVSLEAECGRTILHYFLSPFLGKELDRQQRIKDYSAIYKANSEEKIHLRPTVELFLVHRLMVDKMCEDHFEEAQVLLEECNQRLKAFLSSSINLRTGLLEEACYALELLVRVYCGTRRYASISNIAGASTDYLRAISTHP